MVSKVITSNFEMIGQQLDSILKRIEKLEKDQAEAMVIVKNLEGSIAFLSVLSAKLNTNSYEITSQIEDKIDAIYKDINAEKERIINEFSTLISSKFEDLEDHLNPKEVPSKEDVAQTTLKDLAPELENTKESDSKKNIKRKRKD
ncbi:MAG: hypothetical protein ACP5NL_05235 [Thermoplasmata archaeon]